MLWLCEFTWQSGTTRAEVAERFLQQHEAGNHRPEQIRGWYTLAGGGAGILIVEADRPEEITAWLQPYMDIISWDVRAIYGVDYGEQLEQARQLAQQAK